MPRGEGEAAAEAANSLVTPKNEPAEAASASRLLSATSWMSNDEATGSSGDFVASTIDVDAIKRSPERSFGRKEPLMTIPENWATIDEPPTASMPPPLPNNVPCTSKKSNKVSSHNPEDCSEDDDSDSDSNSESSFTSESGSECSSCSTCSEDDEDEDESEADEAEPEQEFNRNRFIVECRSAVKRNVVLGDNNEVICKGSFSQAEALPNNSQQCKKLLLPSQQTNYSVKSGSKKSSNVKDLNSRKFFKRAKQNSFNNVCLASNSTSSVSNGPNYRQHQPSHHHHQLATPTPAAAATTATNNSCSNASASGSCVMERLSSSSSSSTNSTVSHLHSEEVETIASTSANQPHGHNEVAQIEHFAEQLVGHMAKDQQAAATHQNSNHSDHTFHSITEGLQVIEDEDLVAILKDVSGDNYHEDNRTDYNDCDKRLRNLDFVNDPEITKMKKIRSTADVVAEAIQRFDSSSSSSSVISSVAKTANKSDLSNNKAKCQSLVNQQRQRHSSSKKRSKNKSSSSGYTPILPAPDIDLYLNSNSNVSPDSGIQSEGNGGLTNSSPPQLLQGASDLSQAQQTTPISQSFQFSPGSAAVYSWPAAATQNGYYPGSISGDWTMTTNSGYILSNSGTALIVTSLQPPEVSPQAEIQPILPAAPTAASSNVTVPFLSSSSSEVSKEVGKPLKRGRGRPKGSKNKKKKVTMESGCQTVESSLESKMSSVSSSPCSVIEDEDQVPPPAMFMGGGIEDLSSRGRPRKDPPLLEPQVEPPPPPIKKRQEVIILESEEENDDDRSTIMFSDGEDDPEDEVLPPPELPKELPPVLEKPPEISKVKKKKKKKNKSESTEATVPPVLTKPKKKRKKRSKDRSPMSPPVLEPIQVQCEPNSEFEQVPVKVSPVLSPKDMEKHVQDEEEDINVPEETPEEPIKETPPKEDFSFGDLRPIFGVKFRTLKVDKFWSKKKAKKQNSSVTGQQPLLKKQPLDIVPKLATKAAVKEIVNVPLVTTSTTPSTKTMLAVLKSTNIKSKPGRKKKGKSSSSSSTNKKKESHDSSDKESISSKSPAFSPRSVASSTDENEFRKKKSKNFKQSLIEMGWRTKHKNVVDPLFLGELEHVLQDMSSVQIDAKMPKDIWPDRPTNSVPSIFRKRKIILNSTNKTPFEKKRGRAKKADKEAEQRLPLKKRHHHHQHQQSDQDPSSNISVRRTSGAEKKSSSGRSSRKSSTDEQKKQPKESKKNEYLPQGSGTSPVKSVNIVDTIAACVDKYTGSNGKVRKDLTQPLTVLTTDLKAPAEVVKSLGSPRKRHLLKMQNQGDLAPPTLEKASEEIVTSKPKANPGETKGKQVEDVRPSSPPKLSRFDEKPAEIIMPSPVIPEERPSTKVYQPRVSDISEDDFSDLDKAISPRIIKPRIMKQTAIAKNSVMNCSVRVKKLPSPKELPPELPPVLNEENTTSMEKNEVIETEKPKETNEVKEDKKKKKKRKANRTGFPAIKKKKKLPSPSEVSDEKVKKHSRKAKKTSLRKKILQQPIRASARIIAEKAQSDSDSRPGSRLEISNKRPPSSAETIEEPPVKRSKLYEDVDENIDCLALLPPNDNEEEKIVEESNQNPNPSQRRRRKGFHLEKKNYLIAGLFSNFYKEDPLNQPLQAPVPINKVVYKPEEHIHGLLPPPYYCGRQMRQRKEEFSLPYDLWWQHVNKQLPGRDVVPTWNYKRIKSNVYFDIAKPAAKGYDMQPCHCILASEDSAGCNEECINRMTYNECDSDLCSLPEDKCANRRIQKQKKFSVNVERFMTEMKGWGIKTKIEIRSGDFIMEYVGEVVSEKEFKLRMLTEYIEDTHHYCLHLDGGTVIDGHRMGNECRFVNHSCEPNCEMQKWNVNGHYRMALFALRNIEANEELTYDYNFSLFNPHEGQKCCCGSEVCRGVIGGKTQRINGKFASSAESTVAPSSHKRKSQETCKSKRPEHEAFSLMAPLKPLTNQLKSYVQEHHCFLVRNYEKVRVFREAFHLMANPSKESEVSGNSTPNSEDMILTGITALTTARSMQTRRLAIAQDDPKVHKVVKVAQILREIFAQVTASNPESKLLKESPSKKKFPAYYTFIEEPIDFNSIEKTINSGAYTDPDQFDKDMVKLFQNFFRFFGSQSPEGKTALELRKSYYNIKLEYLEALQETLGEEHPLPSFRKRPEVDQGNPEDVIDCPCGQFKEEGTMIQCEKCQIWQHLDCVEPPDDPDSPYFCSKCSGVPPKLDIKLVPQPEHYPGDTDYVSLMRDDLQVRLGDTVYVLRALKTNAEPSSEVPDPQLDDNDNNKTSEKSFNLGGIKHKMMSPVKGPSQEASNLTKNNYPSYKSVIDPDPQDMDIFHVERLWINDKGERFAFGYHYLRPNETFHEASRKFFPNEVFRIPIYEVLPLDTIWRQCWVLDLPTYCKGRPLGSVEEHVYICEFRVDKKARLFDKIPKSSSKSNAKSKFPAICTKWFAFHTFDVKLKPIRNFTPHEVPEKWKSAIPNARSKSLEDDKSTNKLKDSSGKTNSATNAVGTNAHINANKKPSLKIKHREKLETTLQRLLKKLPNSSDPVDASHLLGDSSEGGKRPKRWKNHPNHA